MFFKNCTLSLKYKYTDIGHKQNNVCFKIFFSNTEMTSYFPSRISWSEGQKYKEKNAAILEGYTYF